MSRLTQLITALRSLQVFPGLETQASACLGQDRADYDEVEVSFDEETSWILRDGWTWELVKIVEPDPEKTCYFEIVGMEQLPMQGGYHSFDMTKRGREVAIVGQHFVYCRRHRDNDKPATRWRDYDGEITCFEFWQHGLKHRDTGYAVINYDDNCLMGTLEYKRGKKHGRETTYNADGSPMMWRDFEHGVLVSEELNGYPQFYRT